MSLGGAVKLSRFLKILHGEAYSVVVHNEPDLSELASCLLCPTKSGAFQEASASSLVTYLFFLLISITSTLGIYFTLIRFMSFDPVMWYCPQMSHSYTLAGAFPAALRFFFLLKLFILLATRCAAPALE